jgi:hypothetical protein
MTKEEIICYKCGNPFPLDITKARLYLCDSCVADVKKLVEALAVTTEGSAPRLTPRGTQIHQFNNAEGEPLCWAMYNPTKGDEIEEIADHLQQHGVPMSSWEFQVQDGTHYLLVVGGDFTRDIVPWTMEEIDPAVTIGNLEQIVFTETPNMVAEGRGLSEFITGKPCGNKLEVTCTEVVEAFVYGLDLLESGLPLYDMVDRVLTRFYVSDATTRKAALIGMQCQYARDMHFKLNNRYTRHSWREHK